jgi:hypothetical protein
LAAMPGMIAPSLRCPGDYPIALQDGSWR